MDAEYSTKLMLGTSAAMAVDKWSDWNISLEGGDDGHTGVSEWSRHQSTQAIASMVPLYHENEEQEERFAPRRATNVQSNLKEQEMGLQTQRVDHSSASMADLTGVRTEALNQIHSQAVHGDDALVKQKDSISSGCSSVYRLLQIQVDAKQLPLSSAAFGTVETEVASLSLIPGSKQSTLKQIADCSGSSSRGALSGLLCETSNSGLLVCKSSNVEQASPEAIPTKQAGYSVLAPLGLRLEDILTPFPIPECDSSGNSAHDSSQPGTCVHEMCGLHESKPVRAAALVLTPGAAIRVRPCSAREPQRSLIPVMPPVYQSCFTSFEMLLSYYWMFAMPTPSLAIRRERPQQFAALLQVRSSMAFIRVCYEPIRELAATNR